LRVLFRLERLDRVIDRAEEAVAELHSFLCRLKPERARKHKFSR